MTLNEIAKKMCAKGKGVLAADESTGTIAKRFKSINVENLEKNRLIFRQSLFSSSAMKSYIGGVILFDETIRQKTTLGPTISENTMQKSLISILGGGDTIAAINKSKSKLSFTHLSTAGGAFLEYLEGKDLPGLSVLK